MKYILVVRGDGGPHLPKLEAKSIGGKRSLATSIDLIRYINREYFDHFITGAATNPYNPMLVAHITKLGADLNLFGLIMTSILGVLAHDDLVMVC